MSAEIKTGLQSIKESNSDAYSHLKNLVANLVSSQSQLTSFEQ